MKDKVSISHDDVMVKKLRQRPRFAAEYLKAARRACANNRRSKQCSKAWTSAWFRTAFYCRPATDSA
jgi:hypothetical protein